MKKLLNHAAIKPILMLIFSLFSTQYVFCDDNIDLDNKKINKFLGWSLLITIIIIYYITATGGGSDSAANMVQTVVPLSKLAVQEPNKDYTYLEMLKILTSYY